MSILRGGVAKTSGIEKSYSPKRSLRLAMKNKLSKKVRVMLSQLKRNAYRDTSTFIQPGSRYALTDLLDMGVPLRFHDEMLETMRKWLNMFVISLNDRVVNDSAIQLIQDLWVIRHDEGAPLTMLIRNDSQAIERGTCEHSTILEQYAALLRASARSMQRSR
jgi:hypothetical protein